MNPIALARTEWLKTRRRVAFSVALAFFFGILLLGMGIDYYMHIALDRGYNGRPGWPALVSSIQGFGLLIMLVTVVLLIASEKTWRTERQNVIDGWSRDEYFVAKLIVVIAFALLLWTGALVIGGVFELLNRRAGEPVEPQFVTRLHVQLLGAALIYLLLVGALGMFFGTVASSAGAALALVFLFLFAEVPIMMRVAREGGAWAEAAAYLPVQVLAALGSSTTFDAASLAQYRESASQQGLPMLLAAPRAVVMALVYSTLLCAGAWLSIRRRDL